MYVVKDYACENDVFPYKASRDFSTKHYLAVTTLAIAIVLAELNLCDVH